MKKILVTTVLTLIMSIVISSCNEDNISPNDGSGTGAGGSSDNCPTGCF